jgi:predicted Zn-ribbon and HTH transcriptional regulator
MSIIRATELEQFVLCEARHGFHKQYWKTVAKQSTLSVWKLLHLARQSKELASIMVRGSDLNIKERNIVNELIRHADRFAQPSAYEVEVCWTIDWVTIVWHIDEIVLDIDRIWKTISITIIDNKTSSWVWDREDFAVKLQRYIYSYLCHLNTWVEKIVFIYRVFNKKNLITDKDIQEIREEMNIEECKTKVSKWIKAFKTANEKQVYVPTRCKQCFYCPYREECKAKYITWSDGSTDIKFQEEKEQEEEIDF